ncbi:hypothetical protein COW36_17230 [bacterium (Candidatus Blackallbacteria) CG17_big_fil_post_rev_8_21_14_2_50_48_46]|uniref:YaeQ family protein n=1 Tax=bacterium (Candidatus Blackallbacteria) CG17_big_fil_post_rev_8_21_14_2_50_48_46 TaxID=2014261 RepID=A0A2M7G0V7_9BACT|nr:MAG: hypothetical protein COW64_01500 [bacterium (Candidatus Blackallbacteria) CG18_big_fil_WC_8_21_14_2_50_49_26]PIW15167.1 MAG: hypothetical protein COW36_17230 [bacterium (Candidatus Blackallbacteria) CG17_big_fil_post_rev_8_21_14_2_50_48_46]PIW50156.1 MAG: hypothetical protein COW20_03540 [bacterium (Candidatus Blackallbacteria) CG13_big_fil_rev_8_21_14_2_50_49_14]
MALKATIFKAELQISDLNRHYYESHSLTLARHPSETDERMMVRLLAFALFAAPGLSFTRGLSTVEEPELWRKSLSDEIELWIDLGLPDAKRLGKACGRAQQVQVVSYGGRNADLWWKKIAPDLKRFKNLSVLNIPFTSSQALAKWAERSMQLQCMLQDAQIWLTRGEESLEITPDLWLKAGQT